MLGKLNSDIRDVVIYNSQKEKVQSNQHYVRVAHIRHELETGITLVDDFMEKRCLLMQVTDMPQPQRLFWFDICETLIEPPTHLTFS
jgi:hypothetical protein